MPKIIFDTAIGSSNLGDHIIMDAVNQIIEDLFEDDFVINIATHQRIHTFDLPILRKYDLALVGGTNLLKNDNIRDSQWKIGLKELLAFRHKAVLLGVGWWQYQDTAISAYSRFLYRNILSPHFLHAVRDGYTLQKLASIDIRNVINTGCPTVWMLDEAHCRQISVEKKPLVVTTITDYMRHPEKDRQMLDTLLKEYDGVHVWLQGSKDKPYLEQLMGENSRLNFIAPKLSAFNRFLEENDCEYVGTRLHAGIRALQKKRRAIIIGIDNRALEMRKDIGLNVLERSRMEELSDLIYKEEPVRLAQDWEAIFRWKSQFEPNKF